MSRRSDERQRDAILHLSTRNGIRLNGNTWTIPVGANALHGKNIARVYPTHVMVPNVFDNVRAPYNTFTVENATTPAGVITITVPEAFYNGTELAVAITTALAAAGFTDLTIAFISLTAVQTQFTITNASATETYNIIIPPRTSLGLLVGGVEDEFPIAPAQVIGFGEPNLAGVRIVHIKSEKFGHAMGLHSVDSTTHDMCVSVPFHDVVYGGVAHYEPNDTLASVLDMAFDICISNGVTISLWDEQMLPLTVPVNLDVELQFKIIHGMNAL